MSHLIKRRLDGSQTLLLTHVERRIHAWPSAVLLVCSCFVTKQIIKIQIPRRRIQHELATKFRDPLSDS